MKKLNSKRSSSIQGRRAMPPPNKQLLRKSSRRGSSASITSKPRMSVSILCSKQKPNLLLRNQPKKKLKRPEHGSVDAAAVAVGDARRKPSLSLFRKNAA